MEIPVELIQNVYALAPTLTAIPGIVALGAGFREENGELVDDLAVRILVEDASNLPDGIPDAVGDVPVCIVEFPVEPLFNPDTTTYPDIPGGAQIQPAPLASGTLGTIAHDEAGNPVGLTCHHVAGDLGAALWQSTSPPSVFGAPLDLTDTIGRVIGVASPSTQTIPVPAGPLLFLGSPIDAAVVNLDEAVLRGRTLSTAITDHFGVVTASTPPTVGMFVKKRGSQSGPTGGQVVGYYPIVPWLFGQPPLGHQYVMTGQYEIFYNPARCPDGIFSRGGDSGSLVLLDGTQTAVGLLWGGVPQGGIRAMMCDVTAVEHRLAITVASPGA